MSSAGSHWGSSSSPAAEVPLQNLVLVHDPTLFLHYCVLGCGSLRSCQTSPWGWRVPSGDPCSHRAAGMNGSERVSCVCLVSHSWGSLHRAFWQEFLRGVQSLPPRSCISGAAPSHHSVRSLPPDPFPTLIPKGANRNKLPSGPYPLNAHSPQVHWVEAFGRLKPLLS